MKLWHNIKLIIIIIIIINDDDDDNRTKTFDLSIALPQLNHVNYEARMTQMEIKIKRKGRKTTTTTW